MPNHEPIYFEGGATQSESESCTRYGLRPEVVRRAMALFQQRKNWRSVLADLEAYRLIERKSVTKAAVQNLVCEYYRDDILRLAERGLSLKRIQTALKEIEKVDVGVHAVRDCISKGPRPGLTGWTHEIVPDWGLDSVLNLLGDY